MKLTKKMENLLNKRIELAIRLNNICREIDDFIKINNLEEDVEDCDWLNGVEIYAHPYSSAERIKEAIRNKED